ncbi:unnamed protein product [Mytilus coruscus]|uniref:Uncharacterized protein n=1 Tax=Mytilus coruscus TaxID=42192 RepID=A0A6J8BT19_MYTCO|nr:unnamed protein product [Mytilus coruscus]
MHCLDKYRKGRRYGPSNENQIAPGNNGTVEMEERLYDLIDENNMNENRVIINDANVNGYLEVVDRNSNSESSIEEKDDSTSYLNPYESLAKTGYRFEYKNNHPSDSSCSTTKSGNVEFGKTNRGYLSLYEPLMGNRQLISYAYEIPVIYNAMKCKTVNSRSFSSGGSLTIRYNTNMDASCRRYSI